MSFRLKTILGIAGIEILLLSILVVSGLHYLRTSNEELFLSRSATVTRLVSTMTSDAVVSFDLAALDSLVAQALKNPGVVFVRIRHQNGRVLSEGGDPVALREAFNPGRSLEQAQVEQRFDAQQPIEVAGRTIGQVELGFDTRPLTAVLADAKQRMFSLAGLEIVLVALFGLVLGQILTKQLASLQKGARKVAKGEFGYAIKVRGKDELADTAVSFNKMSESLRRYAQDLEDSRRKAEAGQALAESILGDAVESISEGIVIVDGQSRVLHANSASVALQLVQAGQGATSFPGVPTATDTRDQADGSVAPIGMAEFLNTDEAADHWTVNLPDGRSALISRRPMKSGGWVFAGTDVTPIVKAQERERQLERELMQAQKLEALGTLAGGIAHEINTPIQYIGDNLRFLDESASALLSVIEAYDSFLDTVAGDEKLAAQVETCRAAYVEQDVDYLRDEIRQAAEQSIDGVKQVSGIVLAMKEFSHPTSKERAPVELNRVIERTTVVCRSEWKHVAELVLDLDPSLPSVMAHEGELNQVVLNLVINAAHAIKDRGTGTGTITIRTRHDAKSVHMEVVDTGTGIPEAVRDRVFEPFFTTKPMGKGTGQGLALCRDIVVSKHGGDIRFATAVGEGTTFFASLPIL